VRSTVGRFAEYGNGADPVFGFELWIRTEFRGQPFWFYNPDHLQYVCDYVAADVRERIPEVRGKANSTLTSRLPRWVKSAKNRDALLKVMAKLRQESTAALG
jgi:hypothetical protein